MKIRRSILLERIGMRPTKIYIERWEEITIITEEWS